MGLHDYGIYQTIKRNARVLKEKIALISGDQKISYRKFLEKIDRLACGLIGVGLERGDRIGVLALNSLEYVYLYGAAAKIGCIMLPINWRLNLEEVEYAISAGSPKVIFVGSEFQAKVTPLLSKFGFITESYSIGPSDENFVAFADLMEHGEICPECDVNSEDPYVIIYTAAVHGKPRGATLTHQNIIFSNLQSMYIWNLTKEDVHILMLPLFHLAALSIALCVIHAGGLNIILPKFDANLVLKHIQEDKVTIFAEFAPMLTNIMDKAQEGKYDLSSVRNVLGLDQPETIKRFEEISGATFWIGYGQTETSSQLSLGPYFERPGSTGPLAYISEVEIMDDFGNILETEQSGEIVVRGPMVFRGYWDLPRDNEYTFRDGWHHTGDIGRFDEDGYLWYEGRKTEKELIKPGGENVYPAEVEKVVLEHPLIEETSVIGVPDKQWGEAIKAICVLKERKSIEATELIDFVAARIARYKKPKHVVFVSNLPKNDDGSIDRQKIKELYGDA